MKKNKSWYRFPMVWMLISIPMTAVIGGVVMITLAVSTSDGLVHDDYYKQGLQINRRLERDKNAANHGVYAQLYWADAKQLNLQLQANDSYELGDAIDLDIRHPTRPGFDQHLRFSKVDSSGLYQTELNNPLAKGDWLIEISTKQWRLQGRLSWPNQQRLSLTALALNHDIAD